MSDNNHDNIRRHLVGHKTFLNDNVIAHNASQIDFTNKDIDLGTGELICNSINGPLIGVTSFNGSETDVIGSEFESLTDTSNADSLHTHASFELNGQWKIGDNNYMEYTETDGDITQVDYWSDSGKGTKLFTKEITYTAGEPSSIIVTDEITNDILTTTINYAAGEITDVTKVLS